MYSIASQITQGLLARKEPVADWSARHTKAIERLQRLQENVRTQGADLAPVSVALRELRHLV